MKHRRAALSIGLLLFLVLVTACTKPPISEPWTTGRAIALDDPRALRALEAHLERRSQGQALSGTARVVLEGPDFKLNRPQRIAIAAPDKIRFEVLGLFDVLAALLVGDGERFGFFEASTGRVTRGPMTSAFLWEWARLDLNPEAAVDLLLATPAPTQTMTLTGFRTFHGVLTGLCYSTPHNPAKALQ